ncbi:MAG: glycosyltransferase, partial [Gemmatimonadetes bacterium]|nr:glycosyltransferase [Gemmatimonadota bacterium]
APALRARAERLGLADRVHLVGETRNPWAYMAQATVLALPSRTEAFPNVIGEALALGVPVVATTCAPGIREYLGGGRCGVLVPPDDPAALADALERVLRDPDLRARLAEDGLREVQHFGLGPGVERYERLLEEVIRA